MFNNENEIKQEVADFVMSFKDTAPIFHKTPRFLHASSNLDMRYYNMKDYIELYYALGEHEVGNEYNWKDQGQIKVTVEFGDMFVSYIVAGLEYNEEELPVLAKFIKENDLEVVIPEEKEDQITEDDLKGMMQGLSARGKNHHFIINSVFIYDFDKVKEVIMALDNQLNNLNEMSA